MTEDGPGPDGPDPLELAKPVIAAVEGYAVAGGLELAVWCDLRVAAEDAAFGVFCRRFGVPLIDGGTVRLPRLIGQGRALDLILTGREVGAEEALAMGLVNRVVPTGAALDAAVAWGRELAALPQTCLRNDRLSALDQWGLPLGDALRVEIRLGLDSLARPMPAPAPSGSRRRGRPRRLGRRHRPLSLGSAPMPDVAAFDFDGTLTEGGSVLGFLVGPARAPHRGRRPPRRWLPAWPTAHWSAGRWPTETKELLFERVLAGVDAVDGSRRSRDRFARHHLARHLRPDVRDRFDWHRGGVTGWSSCRPRRRSTSGWPATCSVPTAWSPPAWPSTTGGVLTGRYQGANCRGEEKLRRLRAWMDEPGPTPTGLWAYGNSRGDLRMLRAADVGVNVGRLGRLGRLRSFPGLAADRR